MLRNLLVLTYFGTAYAINAINVHTSSFDSTSSTLRCSVEEGKEYAPDRLMSAIKFLEMVEEFKRVSVNKGLLPDLDEIKLIGSCSAENVKAPERVEIVCQVSEREVSCFKILYLTIFLVTEVLCRWNSPHFAGYLYINKS